MIFVVVVVVAVVDSFVDSFVLAIESMMFEWKKGTKSRGSLGDRTETESTHSPKKGAAYTTAPQQIKPSLKPIPVNTIIYIY